MVRYRTKQCNQAALQFYAAIIIDAAPIGCWVITVVSSRVSRAMELKYYLSYIPIPRRYLDELRDSKLCEA